MLDIKLERYQLMYPTLSKQTVHEFEKVKRSNKQRNDRFEIKEMWTIRITARIYHGEN